MVDTAIPLQQYAFLYPFTERTREHSDLIARFIYDFTLRLWLALKNIFQKNQVLGKKRELPSLMLNTGKEIKFVKKINGVPQQTWWLPNGTDVEKRKNCLLHLSLLLRHYPDIDPKLKNSKTCKLEELDKTILKRVTDRVQFIHKIIEVHNWRAGVLAIVLAENPTLHALHGGE